MDMHTSLGPWIKKRRKTLELTQDELSQRIGCSISTLRKIETGVLRPSRQMAERIAHCLEIDAAEVAVFVKLARTPVDVHSPVASSGPSPHIPAPEGTFIGREQELAFVLQSLQQRQLITLVGPPGVGKTRLAIEVATRAKAQFGAQIAFVPLESVSEAPLVIPALAETLDISEEPGPALLKRIQARIGAQRFLLVLDNFEHVLDATADIADLIARCPQLSVLVTSQEVLHLSFEQQVPIRPLPLPPQATKQGWHEISTSDAVALFVAQAQRVVPTFALTAENAPIIASICARLDGLPLAIQLVAARVKLQSPSALLAHLDALTGFVLNQQQARSARQHTLRSAIAWSYESLTAEEQHLFRMLGVFVGGCSLDALEALVNPADDEDTMLTEHLATLLDKSMVQCEQRSASEPRFSMLTMLREYALEQLLLNNEYERVAMRHAQYYLDLVETASARLRGPEELVWLQRLSSTHDNIRAALEWSISSNNPTIALQLCATIWRFWHIKHHVSEGRRWLTRALAFDMHVEPAIRAKAYHAAATLATMQDDSDQAIYYYQQSLTLRRELNDIAGLAASTLNLGVLLYHQANYAQAQERTEEAINYYIALQNQRGLASALTNMGIVLQEQEHHGLAENYYNQALEILTELEHTVGQANLLALLGTAAREQGQLDKAKALFMRSLELHRQIAAPEITTPLEGLGYIALAEGDSERARAYLHEHLRHAQTMEHPRFIIMALEAIAHLAVATGQPLKGVRLWGAANSLRTAIKAPLSSVLQRQHTAAQQRIQQQCSAAAWQQAWDQGAALHMEQVIEEAFQL